MITVLGLWDPVWMDPARTERRLWKQTIKAYAVDTWGMVPPRGGPFSSPVQYETPAEMLAAHDGPRTFLIAPDSVPHGHARRYELAEYEHPGRAIYVLGNTADGLAKHVRPCDDVVSMRTTVRAHMFGHAVICAVLYDRQSKGAP